MEMMKFIAKKIKSCSVNHVSQNNKIFDKDGKRETEKTILREQLLASWLRQKQLEKEVIRDMVLQWGRNSRPSENLGATNESISKTRNGKILCEDQRRELEKRVIGEELLSSWLHRKELEEEVITELFGEDTKLQRGKDSIASDDSKVTSDTCNKPLINLQKHVHMQYKVEGSALVPYVRGPISLNGQDWNDQSPGNHTDGGLTGSVPIQRSLRAPNNTNREMLIGLGKGSMTPVKIEGSALVPYVQGPISLNGQDWNDQRPGNRTDGGLTGGLPIQRPPRAPNNTNHEMLIGLGKGAMTPLVSSVTECASQREDKVDTLLIGGDDETAGKMITKRKRWECDLCNVITNDESVLNEHLKGKRHLAKQKASR